MSGETGLVSRALFPGSFYTYAKDRHQHAPVSTGDAAGGFTSLYTKINEKTWNKVEPQKRDGFDIWAVKTLIFSTDYLAPPIQSCFLASIKVCTSQRVHWRVLIDRQITLENNPFQHFHMHFAICNGKGVLARKNEAL
jgi:CRISPR/Cas system CSM-associated protein Csm3 (group 7 of RAMP superfamily)